MSQLQSNGANARSQADLVWEYLDEMGAATSKDLRGRFGRFPRKIIQELRKQGRAQKIESSHGIFYSVVLKAYTFDQEAA